jgi:hypothetical protein
MQILQAEFLSNGKNRKATLGRQTLACPIGGPQQNNYGWVAIPATANEALKALAISIYFGGHPARIDTSGCDGINESVSGLYSPGG